VFSWCAARELKGFVAPQETRRAISNVLGRSGWGLQAELAHFASTAMMNFTVSSSGDPQRDSCAVLADEKLTAFLELERITCNDGH
jgi:hypothetical protein